MNKIDIQKIKEQAVKNGKVSLMTEKKDKYILEGGELGFDLASTFETPDQFSKAIKEKRKHMLAAAVNSDVEVRDFWRLRYEVLQIEWMFEIMKYVWGGYKRYSARAGIAVNKACRELGIDERELGYYN